MNTKILVLFFVEAARAYATAFLFSVIAEFNRDISKTCLGFL